jgi:hypothetical protein
MGRFMLRLPAGAERGAAVIFPPGYPALLAIGFRLGVPLLIGPLLAASLVLATAHLMRSVVRAAPALLPMERPLVHGAALVSACCAVMRFHTADTMSHGLAALCFTMASSYLLRLTSRQSTRGDAFAGGLAFGGGLALGLLFATRPVSALAVVVSFVLYRYACLSPADRQPRSAWLPGLWLPGLWLPGLWMPGLWMVGMLPGALLWFGYQEAVTGSMSSTAQALYYAVSDGPPGCFRYGFGRGIGCLGEHAEFVNNSVGDRYGLIEAAGTTLRRLKTHVADPLNSVVLFPFAIYGGYVAWRQPRLRLLVVALPACVLAYAPFYFDGNIPGGGARMLVDLLPIEHVLAVLAAASLSRQARRFARTRPSGVSVARAVSLLGAAAVLGFALDGASKHEKLRTHDGGRPMFEAKHTAKLAERDALLFIATDHGFNLAYSPSERQVGRYRGDDFDRLLWEAHGRPPAYRYTLNWSQGRIIDSAVQPLHFDTRPTARRRLVFEGESMWPPREQAGAWVWPVWTHATPCVSRGRSLVFRSENTDGRVLLDLPSRVLEGRRITPHLLGLDQPPPGTHQLHLVLRDGLKAVHRWRVAPIEAGSCAALATFSLPPKLTRLSLSIEGRGSIALDCLRLSKKR